MVAVEGNSGQTYEAYYQDKNTVWYKLDNRDKIKTWPSRNCHRGTADQL